MSDFQSPDWSPTDSEQAKASDYKTNAGGYDHNDLGTVRALLKHTMMERDLHWERIAALEASHAALVEALEKIQGFLLGQELTDRRGASMKFAEIARAALREARGETQEEGGGTT